MREVFDIPNEDVGPITELLLMGKKELLRVEYTPYKSVCCYENCKRYTNVRDFGAEPFFWSPALGWVDLSNQKFYCGSHLHHLKQFNNSLNQ